MELLNRFTNRAQHYSRNRPGYPDAVIDLLHEETGWSPASVVADIGAGTGISSELFLRHGNTVWAVEPNADMRGGAAALQSICPALHLVDGQAEATGLDGSSVDYVTAAQAFHWFDLDRCRVEFRRILRRHGHVVLMWNERSVTSPFLEAYDQLLVRYGTDYKDRWGQQRRDVAAQVRRFFEPAGLRSRSLTNPQAPMDFEGLSGRLMSTSYAPLPGAPNHDAMMAGLREIFDRFQQDGVVSMEVQLNVYWGQLPTTI